MHRHLSFALLVALITPSASEAHAKSQQTDHSQVLSTAAKLHNLVSGNSLIIRNRFGVPAIHFFKDERCEHIGWNIAVACRWWSTETEICVQYTRKRAGKKAPAHCLDFTGRMIGDSWSSTEYPRHGLLRYKLRSGHPDMRFAPLW